MQNSGGMTMPIAMQNTARTPHTGRWIPSRRFPPPQPRRWTISCAARRHSRGRGRQPTHPQSSPSRGASIAACEPCFPNLFQLADRRGPGEGACHRHVCEGSGDLAPFDRLALTSSPTDGFCAALRRARAAGFRPRGWLLPAWRCTARGALLLNTCHRATMRAHRLQELQTASSASTALCLLSAFLV